MKYKVTITCHDYVVAVTGCKITLHPDPTRVEIDGNDLWDLGFRVVNVEKYGFHINVEIES